MNKKKLLLMDWDKMHLMSREEICRMTLVNVKIAKKKWADLEDGLKECLDAGLMIKSKGAVGFERTPSRLT